MKASRNKWSNRNEKKNELLKKILCNHINDNLKLCMGQCVHLTARLKVI